MQKNAAMVLGRACDFLDFPYNIRPQDETAGELADSVPLRFDQAGAKMPVTQCRLCTPTAPSPPRSRRRSSR